jgi:hypothetical protein
MKPKLKMKPMRMMRMSKIVKKKKIEMKMKLVGAGLRRFRLRTCCRFARYRRSCPGCYAGPNIAALSLARVPAVICPRNSSKVSGPIKRFA